MVCFLFCAFSLANRVSSADNPSASGAPTAKVQRGHRQTRSSTDANTVVPVSSTNKKRKKTVEPLGTQTKKARGSPRAASGVVSRGGGATTPRNRPSEGTRQTRYRAVTINVDEEEAPLPRKRKSHNEEDYSTAKEVAEESASENSVDDPDIEIEQERTEDQMAAHLFEQERPQFTVFNEDKEGQCIHSSSAFASTPPLTDFNGTSEPADDGSTADLNDNMDNGAWEDKQNNVPARKISKKAAKKLDYELPQVSTEALSTMQMVPSLAMQPNSSTTSAIVWKDPTNIKATYQGRSWEGKTDLVMGHEICPLEPEGLKHLALKKLVKAADFFWVGWPLTTYVSSRIGNEHAKELKGPGLNTVVVNAYGFTGLSGPSATQRIILTRHFMYGLDSVGYGHLLLYKTDLVS
ncbi:hypothetical protein F5877DRAFT_86030 [Lentinula edodes]|nr:hypothetical protein F5877DRAFT_86030 [Lentinula edodes]